MLQRLSRKLFRIAKNIVAFRYIQFDKQKQLNMFFDGRSTPIYYVKKVQDNKYVLYYFNKKQFGSLPKYLKNTYINDIIRGIKSGSDTWQSSYSDFILKKQVMTTKELAVFMIKNLNMSNHDFQNEFFEKIGDFEEQQDFKKIKYGSWDIILQSGVKDIEQVKKLLDRVQAQCREYTELFYGVVEVKKKLQGRVLADYSQKGDYMRIKANRADEEFVKTFIHELGHRLWRKFLDYKQKDVIERKYYQMLINQPQITFQKGDLIQTKQGFVVEFIEMKNGKYRVRLINKPSRIRRFDIGNILIYPQLSYQDIVKINHQKIQMDKIDFPTNYSKKSVTQFFAECFAYWMTGKLNRELIEFFKKVL